MEVKKELICTRLYPDRFKIVPCSLKKDFNRGEDFCTSHKGDILFLNRIADFKQKCDDNTLNVFADSESDISINSEEFKNKYNLNSWC